MISVSHLFEVGPGAINLVDNYIKSQREKMKQTSDKGTAVSSAGKFARAFDLRKAVEARVNSSNESPLEGKAMHFLGMRSGKDLAAERWKQYKSIYKR